MSNDIPEDVMKLACAAMDAAESFDFTADIVARAIMAERERCAKAARANALAYATSQAAELADFIGYSIRTPSDRKGADMFAAILNIPQPPGALE